MLGKIAMALGVWILGIALNFLLFHLFDRSHGQCIECYPGFMGCAIMIPFLSLLYLPLLSIIIRVGIQREV